MAAAAAVQQADDVDKQVVCVRDASVMRVRAAAQEWEKVVPLFPHHRQTFGNLVGSRMVNPL